MDRDSDEGNCRAGAAHVCALICSRSNARVIRVGGPFAYFLNVDVSIQTRIAVRRDRLVDRRASCAYLLFALFIRPAHLEDKRPYE